MSMGYLKCVKPICRVLWISVTFSLVICIHFHMLATHRYASNINVMIAMLYCNYNIDVARIPMYCF